MKTNSRPVPESLGRLLDEIPDENCRCLVVPVPPEPRADRLFRACVRIVYASEAYLKLAVILIALYFAFEIILAFLPGGAVERVLGGMQ